MRVFARDRAIADIVPVRSSEPSGSPALDGVLDDLERRGALRRGSGAVPQRILRGRLPSAGRSVLDALLEERREGR